MLGHLIAALDRPEVADRLLATLDAPELKTRVDEVAGASGRNASELVAASVRGFIDTASDEDWVQLIAIMGRADNPGLAAMRAILERTLPDRETAS